MVDKTRQWIAIIIVGVLTICCISRELRSPKKQVAAPTPTVVLQLRPTTSVRPSPTARPSPTPRQPITGPSTEELRSRWDELTELQRGDYQRSIRGNYVRWDVEITEVHPTSRVDAYAKAGGKGLLVTFNLPLSEARKLNRKQEVTIEGTILNVEPPQVGEGFLGELVESLVLAATLKDAVVLPLGS
jgi:hypothetical protein